MIPHIIHYCWFGKGQKPNLVEQCMASWHRFMPDWTYMEWNEDNFDVASAPLYVRQAYDVRKYAFVSDYVRLWALEQYGGVYLDTDVEIIRSFEPLLQDTAFIGFEESLAHMPGTCVIGCEPHCQWVKDEVLPLVKDLKVEVIGGNMGHEDLLLCAQNPIIIASQGTMGRMAGMLNPKSELIIPPTGDWGAFPIERYRTVTILHREMV